MHNTFIVAILFSLLSLFGCGQSWDPHVESTDNQTLIFTGEAMTMKYKIIVPANSDRQIITQIIVNTFNEINQIYNKWNPNSELSKLNQLKAGVKAPISLLLERLLQETQKVVTLSEGRFDPTIESLQHLWKMNLEKQQKPTKEEIATISPAIGWDKIHFQNGIFYKDHDLTQLDLGGIAKGFGIDRMIEQLNAFGYPNCFVEWGGEIRASGRHPEGRPWTVYISRLNDDDPDHAIATLYLQDQAIATSGDYLQNWPIQELLESKNSTITYTHIFNAETLSPRIATFNSIASASVVAPTCALADGLATAAMLFSNPAEGKTWSERIQIQYPELSFWFITRNDEKSL